MPDKGWRSPATVPLRTSSSSCDTCAIRPDLSPAEYSEIYFSPRKRQRFLEADSSAAQERPGKAGEGGGRAELRWRAHSWSAKRSTEASTPHTKTGQKPWKGLQSPSQRRSQAANV